MGAQDDVTRLRRSLTAARKDVKRLEKERDQLKTEVVYWRTIAECRTVVVRLSRGD